MPPTSFKNDLFYWFSSIADHWGNLVTGGIIIALYGLLKDRYPHKLGWSVAWKVSVCFLAFAIFQSWESEYLSKLGREADLKIINEKSDRTEQSSQQYQRSSASCQSVLNQAHEAESAALSRTQSAQSTTEVAQSKVQDCLVALGKANEPEKFFVNSVGENIGVSSGSLPTGEKGQFGVVVVQSNRTIPVLGTLSCSSPFMITSHFIASPSVHQLYDSPMTGPHEFKKSFDIKYPASFGGFGSTLIFTVFGMNLNAVDCSFK